ncbi:MAG: hypothetical protein AAF196_17390 [Planctomycetota bacterium]
MLQPQELARALRTTAERLEKGVRYEWGHVGRCNCGHVVQTLTDLDSTQIYRAFGQELTEWSEHARAFCETSNTEVEGLFRTLHEAGLTHQDVLHLEYLSDPAVLRRLGSANLELRRNDPSDAARYLRALADLREEARAHETAARPVGQLA